MQRAHPRSRGCPPPPRQSIFFCFFYAFSFSFGGGPRRPLCFPWRFAPAPFCCRALPPSGGCARCAPPPAWSSTPPLPPLPPARSAAPLPPYGADSIVPSIWGSCAPVGALFQRAGGRLALSALTGHPSPPPPLLSVPLPPVPRAGGGAVGFDGLTARAQLERCGRSAVGVAASCPAARPRKPRRPLGVARRRFGLLASGCCGAAPFGRAPWVPASGVPLSPLRPSGSAPPSLRFSLRCPGAVCALAVWGGGRGRSVVGRSAFRSPRLRLGCGLAFAGCRSWGGCAAPPPSRPKSLVAPPALPVSTLGCLIPSPHLCRVGLERPP